MTIRSKEGYVFRGITIIRGLIRMTFEILTHKITVRQAYYQIQMRLFNKQKSLNDDFDWSRYHHYYREELKSVSRGATLVPKQEDFELVQGHIIQINKKVKPLHPNSHLLYEIILGLNPSSVLEVGCGGGDHLRNIHIFNSQIKLFGVDRSEGQLSTFNERHPELPVNLKILDVTNVETVLPVVDVVYSHAVLMHISETQERFAHALANMLKAAESQVVLLENWTEHNFFSAMQEAINSNPSWVGAKLYFTYRPQSTNVRALILSKRSLPFEELRNYGPLLHGKKLRIH